MHTFSRQLAYTFYTFLGAMTPVPTPTTFTHAFSRAYRTVILNRGPHGPPGGNLQVLGGGNTEHLGNWGGMDPFGGNQQIAINSPGCSSGWRIVAASPVFVDVTL